MQSFTDKKPFSILDLKQCLGAGVIRIVGNENTVFSKPASIANAQEDSITFCQRPVVHDFDTSKTRAGVILCTQELADTFIEKRTHSTLVVVQNPRLQFLQVLERLFPQEKPSGIHPSAIIDSQAKIAPGVFIGPNVTIGRATIAEDCRIDGGVFIYDNVTLGRNVHVKAGAVLGGAGFGFQKDDNGEWKKLPHLGGVIVEDDVEIGSNTCIDRGTLNDTVIGKGTKIDNLVHIAHNAVIGKNCAIIALAEISGSVKIGDHSWISPSACILNGIKIGEASMVGLGAIVTREVADNHRVLPAFSTIRPPKGEEK